MRIPKKVGIYSGTFDPVHEGHLAFAREATRQCGLDKVFFLVEPRPRRKQGVKAFEHRAEMVRLAVQNEPKLGSIILDHQRFTPLRTLPVLTRRFEGAELYMLMGDDGFDHFADADWPNVEYLVDNISFAIGLRKYNQEEAKKRIGFLLEIRGLKMKYKLFQAPRADFSSREIRLQIKKGRQPEGLAPQVMDYIKESGLYAAAGSDSSSKS